MKKNFGSEHFPMMRSHGCHDGNKANVSVDPAMWAFDSAEDRMDGKTGAENRYYGGISGRVCL